MNGRKELRVDRIGALRATVKRLRRMIGGSDAELRNYGTIQNIAIEGGLKRGDWVRIEPGWVQVQPWTIWAIKEVYPDGLIPLWRYRCCDASKFPLSYEEAMGG